jgi:hypothetical protein
MTSTPTPNTKQTTPKQATHEARYARYRATNSV